MAAKLFSGIPVPYNLGKHTHAHTHKMTALQGVLNGSWVDRAASEDRRGGTTMERYGRCRFKAPRRNRLSSWCVWLPALVDCCVSLRVARSRCRLLGLVSVRLLSLV